MDTRHKARSLAVAGILLAVAGCSNDPAEAPESADQRAAARTVTAFLAAVESGDAEAALALTTIDTQDTPCPELFTTDVYETVERPTGVTVGEVRYAGGDGAADVTFADADGKQATGTLWLVAGADGTPRIDPFARDWWLDVSGPTDPPVPGTIRIQDACSLPSSGTRDDGPLRLLPGAYQVTYVDEAGVFAAAAQTAHVPLDQSTDSDNPSYAGVVVEPAITAEADATIKAVLNGRVDRCVESGLIGDSCPPRLAATSGANDQPCPAPSLSHVTTYQVRSAPDNPDQWILLTDRLAVSCGRDAVEDIWQSETFFIDTIERSPSGDLILTDREWDSGAS